MSLVSIITSCGQSHQGSDAVIEVKKAAIVVDTTRVWATGKTLNVVFLDGTPELHNMVAKYANEWSLYANLDFKYYVSEKALPNWEKAHIKITFKATGNNSAVGTDSNYSSKHSMSLSNLSDQNYINRYYVIHEFGHAIGLHHEHQNVNRTFELNEAKAIEHCKQSFAMDAQQCRMHIFDFKSGKGITSSKYDPTSIMHYGLHQDMLKYNVKIPSSYNFSLLDKIEIAKLYPGRITEEEIVEQHKVNAASVETFNLYKNCKLTESTEESIRLNANLVPENKKVVFYSVDSITPSDYRGGTRYENKEVAKREMIENTYCNFDEIELVIHRASLAEERLKSNTLGNCEIPMKEDGSPVVGNCFASSPFHILKKGKNEMAIRACYYTFDSAKEAMKKLSYCTIDPKQLSNLELEEKEKLKATLKFGKCEVMNKKDVVKPTRKLCPDVTPWFVTNDSKTNLVGICTETPESAIKEMKKEKACQP